MALSDQLSKEANDSIIQTEGAIIVGAGPSGLAAAACLTNVGVPNIVLERDHCIAPLWKHKTYDRLKLHTHKNYCHLPLLPFPRRYPAFVPRNLFLEYLEEYAAKFCIRPRFGRAVESAGFCRESGKWHVLARRRGDDAREEYIARFLVVATGENDDIVMPRIPGLETFPGSAIHSSKFKSGMDYEGKKVLVVGCGNSGMEIALDLSNYNAMAFIVVRGPVHVLPREMLGISTFSIGMELLKILPVWFVDRLFSLYSWLTFGNFGKYGIVRPIEGPFELKFKSGKTPVFDVGTLKQIRNGAIKDEDEFFSNEGLPKDPFPNNWKGKKGLYTVGLGGRGLLGSAIDAHLIAQDISQVYNSS